MIRPVRYGCYEMDMRRRPAAAIVVFNSAIRPKCLQRVCVYIYLYMGPCIG